ncbi:MAG: lytic transglycosylase domain-containing protein [Gammaproteobacteria bacterium]
MPALFLGLALAAHAGPIPRNSPALQSYLRKTFARNDHGFRNRYVARVWLTVMSARLKPFVSNPARRMHLLVAIHEAAQQAHVSPELVLAIINVESRFHRFAVSRVGAQGLMQIMPFWLREIGRPHDNLFNIHTNLRIGCSILHYYLQKARGDYALALERYNGRTDSIWYASQVLERLSSRWYWH